MQNNGRSTLKYVVAIIGSGMVGLLSYLSKVYPSIALPCSIIIFVYSIWQLASRRAMERRDETYLDAQARMLANIGAGNLHIQALKEEIKRRGGSKHAKDYFRKALEVDPRNLEGLYGLSSILMMEMSFLQWAGKNDLDMDPRWIQAVQLVERGATISPSSHTFVDILGVLYDIKGDHVEARRLFEKSSHLRSDPYWHLLMCVSYGMSGDIEKSFEQAQATVDEGGTGWVVDWNLGQALLEMGRHFEARDHLKSAIKAGPHDPRVRASMAECNHWLGRFVTAGAQKGLVAFHELKLNKGRAGLDFIQGITHLLLGLVLLTSKLVWKLTGNVPVLRECHLDFLPPCQPEFTLGFECIKKGHWDLAKRHFARCYQIAPRVTAVASNFAVLLSKYGENEEAKRVLTQALKRHPRSLLLLRNQSYVNCNPVTPIVVGDLADPETNRMEILKALRQPPPSVPPETEENKMDF